MAAALPWVLAGGALLALGIVAVTASAEGELVQVKTGGLYRYTATVSGVTNAELEMLLNAGRNSGMKDLAVARDGDNATMTFTMRAVADMKYVLGEPHLTLDLGSRTTTVIFTKIEELEPPPAR